MMAKFAKVALALLTVAASPPTTQSRIFVEQQVLPGARTEILVLDANGGFTALVSIAKRGGKDAGRLALTQGYWLYCGRWRTDGNGRLQVHEKLAESFSYPAPADAMSWRIRNYATTKATGMGLMAGGKRYARTLRPPFDPARLDAMRFTCDMVRKREPRSG